MRQRPRGLWRGPVPRGFVGQFAHLPIADDGLHGFGGQFAHLPFADDGLHGSPERAEPRISARRISQNIPNEKEQRVPQLGEHRGGEGHAGHAIVSGLAGASEAVYGVE